MGTGDFDTGSVWKWFPLGVYSLSQAISAPRAPVIGVGPGTARMVRVDFASILLDYDGGDGNASGQLEISGDSPPPYYPFLNVAGYTPFYMETIDGIGTQIPSLMYQNKWLSQTSNPFYTAVPFTIWLVGESGLFAASTIAASVGLSDRGAPDPKPQGLSCSAGGGQLVSC
jgi:hypothetical protein